jgi:hypothetical protein
MVGGEWRMEEEILAPFDPSPLATRHSPFALKGANT